MVDIVKIQRRTNKDAIEMLEEFIVEIKSGEITDVAIAYVTSRNTIGFEASLGKKHFLMSAALSMSERTFNREVIDSLPDEY